MTLLRLLSLRHIMVSMQEVMDFIIILSQVEGYTFI